MGFEEDTKGQDKDAQKSVGLALPREENNGAKDEENKEKKPTLNLNIDLTVLQT